MFPLNFQNILFLTCIIITLKRIIMSLLTSLDTIDNELFEINYLTNNIDMNHNDDISQINNINENITSLLR
jgi:hypothetical protein